MDTQIQPRLIDVDAAMLLDWVRRDEAIVVDVREPDEYAEERIPGAVPLPLSRFDPNLLPWMVGKKIVLACFIGGRSAEAAERLFAAGHRQALHLDGGLFAWKEAGLATDRGARTGSVYRSPAAVAHA
jgi:rhodanese-related sulfurtransferase